MKTLILLLSLTLLAVGAWQFASRTQQHIAAGASDPAPLGYRVQRGGFRVAVDGRGEVRPARVVPIKSRIPSNQAQLVWLYPEGKEVHQGQVIARFDSKPFMDKLLQAEQKLMDAQASVAAAEKALELEKEVAASKLEAAERQLEIAQIKSDELRDGTGKLKRRKLEYALVQAQRNERIARAELADFDVLLAKEHLSQRERDKVADKLKSASENRSLAQAEMANFERFEWPRMLREADLILEAEQNNANRVNRTTELELKRRMNELVRHQRALVKEQAAVDEIKGHIENCDVVAPIDGVLLYQQLPKPEGKRAIQIGDSIWLGQTFMEIPDTREMIVEVGIREVDITRLSVGLPVEIQLDALPEKAYAGTLTSIESLAQEAGDQKHLREFKVLIRFLEPDGRVRIGMSANASIIHGAVENALVIPVSAIHFAQQGETMVRMADGAESLREVQLGTLGLDLVEVTQGLGEGDRVLLH